MYIISERKFCYLASQRTASKATAKFLMSEFGAQRTGLHHAFQPGIVDDSWAICTTVRNHWDVIVSWYFHVKEQKPFYQFVMEFIESEKYCKEPRIFRHLDHTNAILRYETLQNDFNNILGTDKQIPRLKDSERDGRDYRDFYTYETKSLVARYFKDEIELLGYSYD